MDPTLADLSVLGTSNGAEQHQNVEIVNAVSKYASVELHVIRTESAQCSESVFEKACIETVDLAAFDADPDDGAECDANQKFRCDEYNAVGTVLQLCQIKEVPYSLCAVNLKVKDRIKSFYQIHSYNHTFAVLSHY